jgi:hypothetical protein
MEKLLARFLAGKTVPKSRMELPERIHGSMDIAARERKLGHGKRLVYRPTRR